MTQLTFQDDAPAGKALTEAGIDSNETWAVVKNRLGPNAQPAPIVLVLSALCRAYLLSAADEAERRAGAGAPIKSEHLLLGLLREEQGIIADVLNDLGTSVETMRTTLLAAL